ncbi:hypothetical protein H1R20_g2634, partial [Candolleomyces eurysporus]
MPTTRRQAAIHEGRIKKEDPHPVKKRASHKKAKSEDHGKAEPPAKGKKPASKAATAKKRSAEEAEIEEKPHRKRAPSKAKSPSKRVRVSEDEGSEGQQSLYQSGTIERGHIYFFYRPKVEVEDVESIDEVKNLHMLLIPRPPEFLSASEGDDKGSKTDPSKTEEAEMTLLTRGADAVPAAPVTRNTSKQHYRMITIGKKKLPDPEAKGRHEVFWGTVTSIGDDLLGLVEGLGPKTYETKTRGTRHDGAARLLARGGYAIVNTEARVPSKRETHLGYHISHPSPSEMGDVQASLGVYSSSSFVIQVKNPRAPATVPSMRHIKEAEYSEEIMKKVFGAGTKGRESFGLRFASVETPELLEHPNAQLLFIAAREGSQGLETSLGEGRGEALERAEDQEASRRIEDVFKELGLDTDIFLPDALEGKWA